MTHMLPFPVATHSYFKVTNQSAERQRFLSDPSYEPVFSYGPHMDKDKVARRRERAAGVPGARSSLDLVGASLQLQAQPNDTNLARFRELNEALFGAPRKEYATGLLVRIHGFVTPETQDLWGYIRTALHGEFTEMPDIVPTHEEFTKYREYFLTYTGGVAMGNVSLSQLLQTDLEKTGLAAQGWRINIRDDDSHTKVHHARKTISVGAGYVPRTQNAAIRIAAHEVYGHALRGHQDSVAESEGFAILLEQLLAERFKFRRSYRYLAAALGWGTIGRPLSFREVYEIIWRAMVIVGTYPEEKARIYAFDECARVFRGGLPAMPGAVYLKDGTYFDANVQMWQCLKEQPLDYNEFIDLVEGRRRLLS
ncbi:MAG TPA: hypothetical protein VFZ62_00415 [Candidatus Saccharimonadales bacterium]